MKNLNKRTKTLLAIAGVVFVIVVAGLVLLGPGSDLFGTTVIHISPENPTINVGQVLNMSINSLFGDCFWTSPSYDIAPFYYGGSIGVTDSGKSVQVIGKGPGQVVITAKCVVTRSTTVTVK